MATASADYSEATQPFLTALAASIARPDADVAAKAADKILIAGALIERAAALLNDVPSYYVPDLDMIEGTTAINRGLGRALIDLASKISPGVGFRA